MKHTKRILLSLSFLIFHLSFGIAASPDTLVVAQDGSGQYKTIAGALWQIGPYRQQKQVIYVKKGVYKEKLLVRDIVYNLEICGEDRDQTIITFDDNSKKKDPVTGRQLGTFGSYTLKIDGQRIILRNLTVENTTRRHTQGVALHTSGDRLQFINCRFLGFVDTIFTGNIGSRVLFSNCYIEGGLDFIFGPATAWFEQCTIHSVSDEFVTAASTFPESRYGYVFNRCRLTAADGVKRVLLGRPWRSEYAYTLFMHCHIGKHIGKAGWQDWSERAKTGCVRYYEYENEGPGAAAEGRVPWSRQLTGQEAAEVTPANVFGDTSWIEY